jgi:hypothetical protein
MHSPLIKWNNPFRQKGKTGDPPVFSVTINKLSYEVRLTYMTAFFLLNQDQPLQVGFIEKFVRIMTYVLLNL